MINLFLIMLCVQPRNDLAFVTDFRSYPPKGNLDIKLDFCNFDIAFSKKPYLRFQVPNRSQVAFSCFLLRAPKHAIFRLRHLASAGPGGKGIAPITIEVNNEKVVEDWNVAKISFTWSEWEITNKLRKGKNLILIKAGKLRTSYWLSRVEFLIRPRLKEVFKIHPQPISNALFWEGRFSQCSYNALATVLDHFYGVEPWQGNRKQFEDEAFRAALKPSGLGGYFGWAPWTSYMVSSKKITWNGKKVDTLKATRFSLRTKKLPEIKGFQAIVKYGKGEKERLVKKLMSQLRRGPVIIWTPYASILDLMRRRKPWQHVLSIDNSTDVVSFNPNLTHSVVVNLEGNKVKVYDNSARNSISVVKPGTIVATTSAMAARVRHEYGGRKIMSEKGLGGIKNDEFNVVFVKNKS